LRFFDDEEMGGGGAFDDVPLHRKARRNVSLNRSTS